MMRMLTCGFEEHNLSVLEMWGNVKGVKFVCEHYTYYNQLIIRVLLF